jgi:hypothetical protein
MHYDDDTLNAIYDRDGGCRHLCGSRRAFSNHGRLWAHGGWEVDHGNPRARGGTDWLQNLRVACQGCNRAKGARSSRTFRSAYGLTSVRAQETDWGAVATLIGFTVLVAGLDRGLNPMFTENQGADLH